MSFFRHLRFYSLTYVHIKLTRLFLFANENTTVVHILWLQIIKYTHLFFNVILWKQFAVKAPQMGLLGPKVLLSSKRSPKLSGPVTERLGRVVVVFFFFFGQKVVICRGVLERKSSHAHRRTHLRNHSSDLEAARYKQSFAALPLGGSTGADGRWVLEGRENIIHSFFFSLSSPSAHIFPHSRSCYMNHSLTSPPQTNFCRLIIAAALAQRCKWFFVCVFHEATFCKKQRGLWPCWRPVNIVIVIVLIKRERERETVALFGRENGLEKRFAACQQGNNVGQSSLDATQSAKTLFFSVRLLAFGPTVGFIKAEDEDDGDDDDADNDKPPSTLYAAAGTMENSPDWTAEGRETMQEAWREVWVSAHC